MHSCTCGDIEKRVTPIQSGAPSLLLRLRPTHCKHPPASFIRLKSSCITQVSLLNWEGPVLPLLQLGGKPVQWSAALAGPPMRDAVHRLLSHVLRVLRQPCCASVCSQCGRQG